MLQIFIAQDPMKFFPLTKGLYIQLNVIYWSRKNLKNSGIVSAGLTYSKLLLWNAPIGLIIISKVPLFTTWAC
jgi:hypothetical protein